MNFTAERKIFSAKNTAERKIFAFLDYVAEVKIR